MHETDQIRNQLITPKSETQNTKLRFAQLNFLN